MKRTMTAFLSSFNVRRFGWIIGLIAAVLWFSWAGLWDQYAYTRPDAPNSSLGRIHPLNVHGKNVYLNSHEYYLLSFLMISPWIIIGASILADLIMRKHKFRRNAKFLNMIRDSVGVP